MEETALPVYARHTTITLMTPKLPTSLIFVNYHSVWQLSFALTRLFAIEKNRARYEVIVVNNDVRETLALERLQVLLKFTLLENGRNSGFGSACNRGAEVATGELLGFINPDTAWTEELLAGMINLFRTDVSLGIMGLHLVDECGVPEAWSGGKFLTLLQVIVNNLFPTPVGRPSGSEERLDWVSGAGLFLSNSLFRTLNGFDQNFFLYFEDVDLCLRAQTLGYAVKKDPHYRLIHFGGKSYESKTMQKRHFLGLFLYFYTPVSTLP